MLIEAAALHVCVQPSGAPYTPHRVDLDFGAGIVTRASFAEPAAAAAFSRRYARMQTTGARPVCRVDAYRDIAGVHTFAVRGGKTYRWPHGGLRPGEIAFLSDAILTASTFGRMNDTLVLHAAALAHDGSAFAITGDSNAGKTTTALACAFSGFRFYSDEFCVIRKGLVHPFPRSVSLRAGGITVLAQLDGLPAEALAALRMHADTGWPDAAPDDLFSSWAAPAPAPLRAVFSLRGHALRPSVRRVSAVQLLGRAARYAKGDSSAAERVARVLGTLRSAACYELIAGEPNRTVREIERALDSVEPA